MNKPTKIKDVNKLNILLKEADKELEKFEIDLSETKPSAVDEQIRILYPNEMGIIKDFIHSQITKAYKAGQENMEARLKHLY